MNKKMKLGIVIISILLIFLMITPKICSVINKNRHLKIYSKYINQLKQDSYEYSISLEWTDTVQEVEVIIPETDEITNSDAEESILDSFLDGEDDEDDEDDEYDEDDNEDVDWEDNKDLETSTVSPNEKKIKKRITLDVKKNNNKYALSVLVDCDSTKYSFDNVIIISDNFTYIDLSQLYEYLKPYLTISNDYLDKYIKLDSNCVQINTSKLIQLLESIYDINKKYDEGSKQYIENTLTMLDIVDFIDFSGMEKIPNLKIHDMINFGSLNLNLNNEIFRKLLDEINSCKFNVNHTDKSPFIYNLEVIQFNEPVLNFYIEINDFNQSILEPMDGNCISIEKIIPKNEENFTEIPTLENFNFDS